MVCFFIFEERREGEKEGGERKEVRRKQEGGKIDSFSMKVVTVEKSISEVSLHHIFYIPLSFSITSSTF